MAHIWSNGVVQYIWQNVMPPSFWTLLGISLSHIHTHRKLNSHHKENMQAHEERKASDNGTV